MKANSWVRILITGNSLQLVIAILVKPVIAELHTGCKCVTVTRFKGKILSEVTQSQIRKNLILHLLFAILFFSILCTGHIGRIT